MVETRSEIARPQPSLAAVLADLALSAASAASLETLILETAKGAPAKAYLAKPAKPGPAVILIHEWWGLNDQIKAVAADLASQGYMALAVDLYDGKLTADPTQAGAWMESLDAERARAMLRGWIAALRRHPLGNGKVGTLGWCMGGSWSLLASLAAPVDATVIYYGQVDRPAAELRQLSGPVMGHFARRDQWITQPSVEGFAAAMRAAGKALTLHWYEADHAFANPTGQNFQRAEAQTAWQRTLDFFKAHL
jgi:carboxymethylenebutenolidase